MATTAELLAEARAAYHALAIGQSVAESRDSNGELVRYTSANMSRLKSYIAELEAILATEAGTNRPRGPLRPVWS